MQFHENPFNIQVAKTEELLPLFF